VGGLRYAVALVSSQQPTAAVRRGQHRLGGGVGVVAEVAGVEKQVVQRDVVERPPAPGPGAA
jgi:hypothetical protein